MLCEVHIFDPGDFSRADMKLGTNNMNMFFHKWGFVSSYDLTYKSPLKYGEWITLDETVKRLGHEGRTIDIFKVRRCRDDIRNEHPEFIIMSLSKSERHALTFPPTLSRLIVSFASGSVSRIGTNSIFGSCWWRPTRRHQMYWTFSMACKKKTFISFTRNPISIPRPQVEELSGAISNYTLILEQERDD